MAYTIRKPLKTRKVRSKNPWSADGWSPDLQSKIIAALGVKAAAGMAASQGCTLTSAGPNLEYAK
jgi:hypothetical protein